MGDGSGRLLPARTSYVNCLVPLVWLSTAQGSPICPADGSPARSAATVVVSGGSPLAREEANFFCGLRSSETHPLNLSISISGGRETNRDSLSNGERSGKKPRSEISPSALSRRGELWSGEADCPDPLLASPKLTWNGTPERVRAP